MARVQRRLSTELPEGFGEVDGMPDPRDQEMHRLREENERFRSALTEIKNIKPKLINEAFSTGPQLHFEWCQRIARAALKKPKAK